MRLLKIILSLGLIIFIAYSFGPHPSNPFYAIGLPTIPSEPTTLIGYVQQEESKHKVKKDNDAEIVWADTSSKKKTAYAQYRKSCTSIPNFIKGCCRS